MPESILCATIPFDARFASDDSSHDAYPYRRRHSRHAQAISGAIDEKPMCFKGFMRVSKFLIFVTPSRNSVEQFEQRTDRRLIAAASADGVGKDFSEPCKIEQLLVRTSAR
jgi:hypothetical protein